MSISPFSVAHDPEVAEYNRSRAAYLTDLQARGLPVPRSTRAVLLGKIVDLGVRFGRMGREGTERKLGGGKKDKRGRGGRNAVSVKGNIVGARDLEGDSDWEGETECGDGDEDGDKDENEERNGKEEKEGNGGAVVRVLEMNGARN